MSGGGSPLAIRSASSRSARWPSSSITFKGAQVLSRLEPALRASAGSQPDLRDIKGQESAKRALEVAAAGGHDLFM